MQSIYTMKKIQINCIFGNDCGWYDNQHCIENPKKHKMRNDLLILLDIIIFRHFCIRCKSCMQVCYHAFVFCHVMQCQSGICRCCSAVRGQCVCYPSVTGEHERICELRCDTQVSGELHTCLTCTWSPARAHHTAASHAFFTWKQSHQASVWAQWLRNTFSAANDDCNQSIQFNTENDQ